jgi:hypothetical protein
MRLVVIILAFAAALVAAAILWMRAQPEPLPVNSLQPRGIVWADRVFTDPAELRRWLRARGERYKVWAKHHPLQAATLEHRRLRSMPKAAPDPRAASGGEPRGLDGGILALIAGIAGLGVLTFHLRRQVRVGRPRVRLPAVAVDVAPLANGVRRNLDRLGRVPEVIRAGRARTRAARPHVALPRPSRPGGNGSMPRPVESRPVVRVSRAAEPRVVSDAVVERVVPTVEPATALAALPLVVEEPPQVEELPQLEEPEPLRVEAPPQVEEPRHVEEPPQVEEPREVEQPRATAASQNGNHVHVQQEVPLEPVALPDTTRVDEIVAPPKPRKVDALPKEGWERCAVSCWRGYVTAQFYVHVAGEAEAIATSSQFEWRAWQQAPKDAQAARAALDELQEMLEVAGWEAAGRGDAWYELRFQREPPISW